MNLEKEILKKLRGHTEINTDHVSVTMKNKTAHLTGVVDGPLAKSMIEGIVRSFDEVHEIISTLTVYDLSSGKQGLSIP